MAAILRASSLPQPSHRIPASEPQSALTRAYLTRLGQLHDETARTAYLANLLGRAPYVTALLAVAAIATAFISAAPAAELTTWLVLVLIGVATTARAYSRAIQAPFELHMLKGFARDFAATLVYLGVAWGAGAILVLPQSASLLTLLAFGAGTSALLACALRVKDLTLCFLVPAVSLSAFATVLRAFAGGFEGMAALLLAGAAIAAAIYFAEWLTPKPGVPDLAGLPAV
jgi:hypothetical protein